MTWILYCFRNGLLSAAADHISELCRAVSDYEQAHQSADDTLTNHETELSSIRNMPCDSLIACQQRLNKAQVSIIHCVNSGYKAV